MSVIVALIIVSFGVALIFLIAFMWSVRHDQFEDTYTPAVRILFDDNIDKKIDKKIDSKIETK